MIRNTWIAILSALWAGTGALNAGLMFLDANNGTMNFEDGAFELYDLEKDSGERNNLAKAMPEKLDELKKMLTAWRTELNARSLINPILYMIRLLKERNDAERCV